MRPRPRFKRPLILICVFLITLKLITLSWRTLAVIQQVSLIGTSPRLEVILAQYDDLAGALRDLDSEVKFLYPILRLGQGDIAAVPDLTSIALETMAAARPMLPLVTAAQHYQTDPTAQNWAALLQVAQSVPWQDVQNHLGNTRPYRAHLATLEGLSSRLAKIVRAAQDALTFGEAAAELAPHAVSTLGDGRAHRLIVVAQNNDELRATGGFLTALAVITIQPDGQLETEFLNSYAVDDPHRLAGNPAPPPGMLFGMDIPKWVFRDSNWSPDFPTTAKLAVSLFSMGRHQEPEAVIAVNMNVVRTVVDAIGPIRVNGIDNPVNGDGLVRQMRQAWDIKPGTTTSAGAKDFLKPFLDAIGSAIIASDTNAKLELLSSMRQSLARRDMLLYASQPSIQAVLVEHDWAGVVQKPDGDYLLLVDSNIGYNKVSALVYQRLEYHVSLVEPQQPFAQVSIQYDNFSPEVPCTEHVSAGAGTYEQRMVACYWNALRLFVPDGSHLLAHNLKDIPAALTPVRHDIPGIMSAYSDESGHTIFEGYMLIPAGQERILQLVYRLPPTVLRSERGIETYRLVVQKQPGSPVYPLRVSIDLPVGAQLLSATPPLTAQNGQTISFSVEAVDRDTAFSIQFKAVGSPLP